MGESIYQEAETASTSGTHNGDDMRSLIKNTRAFHLNIQNFFMSVNYWLDIVRQNSV